MSNPVFAGKPSKGAALLAASFFLVFSLFFSCYETNGIIPEPGVKVFSHEGFLCAPVINGKTRLFKTGYGIPQRAASVFGSGILIWDRSSATLQYRSFSGSLIAGTSLKAASVQIDDRFILTRSVLFEEDVGFRFTLYTTDIQGSVITLKEHWSVILDCFPSDLVIRSDGSVLLTGGNRSDSFHRLWYIGQTGLINLIYEQSWQGHFLRIVHRGDDILLFASARDKASADTHLTLINYNYLSGESVITVYKPSELPSDGLCWFGYGFVWQNTFVLPMALTDGTISLVVLDFLKESCEVLSVTADSGGCFVPLGQNQHGFWYLAHDSLRDNTYFSLGIFDGESVYLKRIK